MKLIVSKGCRSDDFILPLITALEQDPFFTVHKINLHTQGNASEMFRESFNIMDHACSSIKPDAVLITGDRIEQTAAANAVFLNNTPIIHLGAGITNSIATYDDLFRHNITLLSDVALCEDMRAAEIVWALWHRIGKIQMLNLLEKKPFKLTSAFFSKNIHVIGNLYLEDLQIDTKLVPEYNYDLVLINPLTLVSTKELLEVKELLEDNKQYIFIGPNADPNGVTLFGILTQNRGVLDKAYTNLPRPQFLGLLKHCDRYITNSSNVYYECLPLGLKKEQIIQVGVRNQERSTPREWNQDYKSSDKIIEILKDWRNKQNE